MDWNCHVLQNLLARCNYLIASFSLRKFVFAGPHVQTFLDLDGFKSFIYLYESFAKSSIVVHPLNRIQIYYTFNCKRGLSTFIRIFTNKNETNERILSLYPSSYKQDGVFVFVYKTVQNAPNPWAKNFSTNPIYERCDFFTAALAFTRSQKRREFSGSA